MSTPPAPSYAFFRRLARVFNSGQSRSLLVAGDVHDLFYTPNRTSQLEDDDGGADPFDGSYQPLLHYLIARCNVDNLVRIVYELNGPIRFIDDGDAQKVRHAWVAWKTGVELDTLVLRGLSDQAAASRKAEAENSFDESLRDAIGRPTVALEFLRQVTLCSRSAKRFRLMIFIEAADMLVPAGDGEITRLPVADRHRVSVMQDWFSDPAFCNGEDSVVLLAESESQVHPRITRLPQVLTVEAPSPDAATRRHYVDWFLRHQRPQPSLSCSIEELAKSTAGLSIHALRQVLMEAAHTNKAVTADAAIEHVETFITSQVGPGVVEFKKPAHTLQDVVGYSGLKRFLQDEFIPRVKAEDESALPGAAVAGPIGAGKTFIFEAVAGSLGLPVLVLKNIRSQYFGQTDVIFERLRRMLEALDKVILFVDEADTQFGGVGPDAHATERRLTGKVQQMMSDPKLRGKVVWLLMTARIERLSPDIRRPGRVGDLIIPVLDPEGEDRLEFVKWAIGQSTDTLSPEAVERIGVMTEGYSAAGYAALRSRLRAASTIKNRPLREDELKTIVDDLLPADIGAARRYQTLQALVNCTRRSLLPEPGIDEAQREAWRRELRELESTPHQ